MSLDTQTGTLLDAPDWQYLMREYYELYRWLSSGGSERIRSHQRAVREAIGKALKDRPALSPPEPAGLPATRHFRRALDRGLMAPTEPVVRAIDAVAERLRWELGYDRMPRGLESKFGYAEIAGPRGPVVTERVILGLVLFAPGCVYPAHAHEGINESYICLSGAVSENHQGVYAPGSLIFNPAGMSHRITVSDREPALLAYAWTGEAAKLKSHKMVFSRPRRD